MPSHERSQYGLITAQGTLHNSLYGKTYVPTLYNTSSEVQLLIKSMTCLWDKYALVLHYRTLMVCDEQDNKNTEAGV